MKNQINKKSLLCYALCYLAVFALLILGFSMFFGVSGKELEIAEQPHSFGRAIQIIGNNLLNYTGYLLTFLLYPLYIFLDLTLNAWSISVSLKAQGAGETFRHLILHGILELPNSILYTFLSFGAFRKLCREKNFGIRAYIRYVADRRVFYILSLLLVIAAGLTEGLLS